MAPFHTSRQETKWETGWPTKSKTPYWRNTASWTESYHLLSSYLEQWFYSCRKKALVAHGFVPEKVTSDIRNGNHGIAAGQENNRTFWVFKNAACPLNMWLRWKTWMHSRERTRWGSKSVQIQSPGPWRTYKPHVFWRTRMERRNPARPGTYNWGRKALWALTGSGRACPARSTAERRAFLERACERATL